MVESIAGRVIKVTIWRRGRGVITWDFTYVTDSSERWFSSAGWYHRARRRTYRLTLDHDYPGKPIWLGFRRNGTWHNAEGLYEVLYATHPGYNISNGNFRGGCNRSLFRRQKTGIYLAARTVSEARRTWKEALE